MFEYLRSVLTQFFPSKPTFTEKDVPSLEGKVYIVTGSNTGVGKELARILYSKHAKVYIAARSEERANQAIQDIRDAQPQSRGALYFLKLDLADLTTIRASADSFLKRETKLHVLFNNAGLQSPHLTKTVQGYEIHLGVNTLGTFLFTKFLTPALVETVKANPQDSVRVIWVSSLGAEMLGEKSVGLHLDNLDYHIEKDAMYTYAISKVGNYFHGVEFGKRHAADGVISIPLNPGNLQSDLYRDRNWLFKLLLRPVVWPPVYGAYTELYAGLSTDITIEKSGSWVIPFGRLYPIRKDLEEATKTEAEGGNGQGLKFWEWTEDQVRKYV